MSVLKALKSATSLQDVALLLKFQPKSLSYIIYIKPKDTLYKEFEIPKKTGGTRKISAPCVQLGKLQTRLSHLLLTCVDELHKERETREKRKIENSISHAFTKKKSIITNAVQHRKKRYVFNVDLENFFGTISGPRVRGYFIKNRNFELLPNVATILTQIACHKGILPQGSPASPVISNLIGHLLDIRLAELAKKHGCTYTRYADDLTFSTNKPTFPKEIGKPILEDASIWVAGYELERAIEDMDFTINSKKTRMQKGQSRQEVTGLTVNSIVNTKFEYRHAVRAMTHSLFKTGTFHRKITTVKEGQKPQHERVPGTIAELNGMLNFIDMLSSHNRTKNKYHILTEDEKKLEKSKDIESVLDGNEKIYRDFLFYKYFFASDIPTVLCEGKTDYVYLQAAIKSLIKRYPLLATSNDRGKIEYKVRFVRFSNTTSRLFGLTGGSDQLNKFILKYEKLCSKYECKGLKNPVIILIDNDQGSQQIYSVINTQTKIKRDDNLDFYPFKKNLYIVATPPIKGKQDTMIEHFFEKKVTDTILSGKIFSWSASYDKKKSYGKEYFSKYVVKKEHATINFNGFIPLLDRVVAAMNDYVEKNNSSL